MIESSNKRAVFVGFFVLIGTLFLIGGILLVGNLRETFTTKLSLVGLFDDVAGLQKGNNIWFSGVKIGTVDELEFYGNSQVKVKIQIDVKAQQYIRKDASLKLSSDGLIGNKILIIYGGTENSAIVKNGDTLKVEKSLSSEEIMNTLQENNKNLLSITTDFKALSKKLANGEGSLGKLLNDDTMYNNINTMTTSLEEAIQKAKELLSSLSNFSTDITQEGSLLNELATDTVIFHSMKTSVLKLELITDTAAVLISNIKEAGNNPNSSIGLLLHDEETSQRLKRTIKNLESSTKKLDEDLEAAQHNIFLRRFFKKKAKKNNKDSLY
jgi:phospholipid/cholesterol/gamma-HCH transport system substrate-binding protein